MGLHTKCVASESVFNLTQPKYWKEINFNTPLGYKDYQDETIFSPKQLSLLSQADSYTAATVQHYGGRLSQKIMSELKQILTPEEFSKQIITILVYYTAEEHHPTASLGWHTDQTTINKSARVFFYRHSMPHTEILNYPRLRIDDSDLLDQTIEKNISHPRILKLPLKTLIEVDETTIHRRGVYLNHNTNRPFPFTYFFRSVVYQSPQDLFFEPRFRRPFHPKPAISEIKESIDQIQ